MTDEQKASIQYAAEWLFRSEDISNRKHAERLRALLAAGASEGQAEPIYQARSIGMQSWGDQSKDGFDHMAKHPAIFETRTVYLHPSAEIAALRERITAQEIELQEKDELVDAMRERIAGMEKDAARWRELKEHTRETEVRRGCTASAFGQPNWLLNYGTMDYTLDAYIEIRARKARQDASSVASKEEPK